MSYIRNISVCIVDDDMAKRKWKYFTAQEVLIYITQNTIIESGTIVLWCLHSGLSSEVQ